MLLFIFLYLDGRGEGLRGWSAVFERAVSGAWCKPLLLSEAVVSFCFWTTRHNNLNSKEAADCWIRQSREAQGRWCLKGPSWRSRWTRCTWTRECMRRRRSSIRGGFWGAGMAGRVRARGRMSMWDGGRGGILVVSSRSVFLSASLVFYFSLYLLPSPILTSSPLHLHRLRAL